MSAPAHQLTLRSLPISNLLDQVDNAATKLGIVDPRECAGQRQSFGRCQKIGHIGRRGALTETCAVDSATRDPFEQEGDRNLQNLGDLLDPAGADTIGAFFVLLYLLERESESLTKFFLA